MTLTFFDVYDPWPYRPLFQIEFSPPPMHVGPVYLKTTIRVPHHAAWWGMGWLNCWLPGAERKELKLPNVPHLQEGSKN